MEQILQQTHGRQGQLGFQGLRSRPLHSPMEFWCQIEPTVVPSLLCRFGPPQHHIHVHVHVNIHSYDMEGVNITADVDPMACNSGADRYISNSQLWSVHVQSDSYRQPLRCQLQYTVQNGPMADITKIRFQHQDGFTSVIEYCIVIYTVFMDQGSCTCTCTCTSYFALLSCTNHNWIAAWCCTCKYVP